MNFGGIFIFVLAVVAFNWIARPVEAFFLCIREWQETDEEEKKQMTCFALLFLVAGIAYLVWRFF